MICKVPTVSIRERTLAFIGWTLLALIAGCGSTRAYIVKIDARDPSSIDLCRKESGGATCETYDGQSIETPARLNVELTHVEAETQYDLQVEQRYFPAQGEDVRRVLGGFLEGALSLSSGFVNKIESKAAEGGERAQENAKAGTNLITNIAALRPKVEGPLIEQGKRLLGEPPAKEPRPESNLLFYYWIKDGAFVERPSEKQLIFDQPSLGPPPPRVARIADADLAFLAGKGITTQELGAFIKAKCAPQSFGTYAPVNKGWAEVLGTVPVNEKTIGKALLLNEKAVGAVLEGKTKIDLPGRISELQKRASEVVAAKGRPDADAETIYVASRVALFEKQTANCIANLEFIAARDSESEYASLIGSARDAHERVKSTSAIFRETVEPFVLRAVRTLLSERATGDRVVFGAVSASPGSLNLVVQRNDGGSKQKLAELTLEAAPFNAVAVVVGPFVTACDDCYVEVDEGVEPGEGSTPATRVIREQSESSRIGAAIAVHLSLWQSDGHHLGVLGGYPLAGGSATPAEVLAGLSYRNTVGLQVGLGAHLFLAQEFEEGIDSPVDLSASGNTALTSDELTREVPRVALFAMFGLSTDLFIDP